MFKLFCETALFRQRFSTFPIKQPQPKSIDETFFVLLVLVNVLIVKTLCSHVKRLHKTLSRHTLRLIPSMWLLNASTTAKELRTQNASTVGKMRLSSTPSVREAPQSLPGVWHIGEGVDILDWQVKPNPFKLSYSSGSKTPDGKFNIPDGTFFIGVHECDFSAQTVVSSTYSDFQETTTRSVKASGSYKSVSGSLTVSSTHVREHMYKYKQTISSTQVNCVLYDVVMLPSELSLNYYFNASMFALPKEYDPQAYVGFLQSWGTHFRKRVSLGGSMVQHAFTANEYVKEYSMTDVKLQANAKFHVSVDASSEKKTEITKEYEQSTETQAIRAVGGSPWKAGDEKWTAWASTVPSSPQVVYEELVVMTDIFEAHKAPKQVQDNMAKALNEYAFREGCTHPGTPTYDPKATVDDGSCQDPPEIPSQLRCTGQGLFHTISDQCIDDGGGSGVGDSLQIFCCGGKTRFCLSYEACPWRNGCPAAYEDKTCSRSGLGGNYMATVKCDHFHNINRVECDMNQNVLLS